MDKVIRFLERCFVTLFVVVVSAALLTACGDGPRGLGTETAQPTVASPAPAAQDGGTGTAEDTQPNGTGELVVLRAEFRDQMANPDGFYMADCPQGGTFQNIMYYDYTTLQQRYLCDAPGCAHDHAGCTSYIAGGGGIHPFGYRGYLFLNYAMYDDGTSDHNYWPSALVRCNPDGSGKQVMVTYPSCELQPNIILGDGESLYFDAPDGFVRLDIESFEKTVIPVGIPMNNANSGWTNLLPATWQGKALCTRVEMDGPDFESYALYSLCVQTGEATLLHEFDEERYIFGGLTPEGKSYYIHPQNAEVRCFDLTTGEDTLVTDQYCRYAMATPHPGWDEDGNEIVEIYYSAGGWNVVPLGGWLVIQRWDHDGSSGIPKTYTMGYNLATGESTDIEFGDFFNGYVHPMMIWANTPHGLLVTEETRSRMIYSTGTGGEPYNYESAYTVYALIDLEDFVHGTPNFRTLAPVPYSGS